MDPGDERGRPATGRPATTDNTASLADIEATEREAYYRGFRDGWTDRGVYEQRTRHAGDDYLAGYADGQAAAGGSIVNLATVRRVG